MDRKYSINGRIWLECNQEKIWGHGRVELLERIHASGSIRQAALQMKMSYKQAWELIKHVNSHFEHPLVVSHRGGKGGGNALVTEYGLKIISNFHQLHDKFNEFLKTNSMLLN